jgi:hypothetical protein
LKSDFNCKNKNPFGLERFSRSAIKMFHKTRNNLCVFYNNFGVYICVIGGPKSTIAVQLSNLPSIHRTESFPSAVIGVVHRPKGAVQTRACVFLLCVLDHHRFREA